MDRTLMSGSDVHLLYAFDRNMMRPHFPSESDYAATVRCFKGKGRRNPVIPAMKLHGQYKKEYDQLSLETKKKYLEEVFVELSYLEQAIIFEGKNYHRWSRYVIKETERKIPLLDRQLHDRNYTEFETEPPSGEKILLNVAMKEATDKMPLGSKQVEEAKKIPPQKKKFFVPESYRLPWKYEFKDPSKEDTDPEEWEFPPAQLQYQAWEKAGKPTGSKGKEWLMKYKKPDKK